MYEVMMEAPRLPFPLFRRGKVREMFDLGDELLMIATDRISAFDVILENGIPRKGEVLNRLSLFWFERMQGLMPNHLSGRRLGEFLEDRELVSMLEPRSMIVRKAEPLRFEGIAWRSGPSGSPWLPGSLAVLDCRVVAAHAAGDHVIYVGEVEAAEFDAEREPLAYYDAAYRRLAPADA